MAKIRRLPFGYRICNGEYTVHEREAEYVRMIYLAYTAGASYQSLAVKMQESDVPYHPENPTWNKHTVKRILENERYTGIAVFPAIISAELFDRAKRLRQSKCVEPKRPRKKREPQKPILLPPDQVKLIPDIKLVKLENQISQELARPVLEPERLRAMIFKIATLKYEAHFHAQEIITDKMDADSVLFDITDEKGDVGHDKDGNGHPGKGNAAGTIGKKGTPPCGGLLPGQHG